MYGSESDAIVKYNQITDVSRVVVLDLKSLAGSNEYPSLETFLNFTGKQITGINIIDDFLFWTDGETEPKKINIKRTHHPIPSTVFGFGDHSKLMVNGVDKGFMKEGDVTVIKKKPSIAPTISFTTVKVGASVPIFEKIFPRFCFRYKYQDGEYSAFSPFSDVVFNPDYTGDYSQGDSFTSKESYNTAMLNNIDTIIISDFVPTDIPKDVVQVDILYKQENSNVVYSVANIKSTDPEFTFSGSSRDVNQDANNFTTTFQRRVITF